jgi:hypothetical protein
MVGRTNGIGNLLQNKLQLDIIIWHCLDHRLQLAVHDCIVDMNTIDHFKSYTDTIYALFSQSPKILNDLKTVASTLSVYLTKTGRVLHSRWVSSSFRSVSAVWNGYSALVAHFKEAAIDTQRTKSQST